MIFVESSFSTQTWRKSGSYCTRSHGVAQTSPESPSERGLLEGAAVLQLAACAGLWPEQRRNEAFSQDHANCPRCDTAEIETEEHRFYGCKGNTTGDPDFVDLVAKTDWIVLEDRVGSRNLSCVPPFCEVLHQALGW